MVHVNLHPQIMRMVVQAHEDRNLANKLTPAERRDKKIEKIVGAAKEGEATPVSVYKVTNLESGKHRFKVKANAEVLLADLLTTG